MASSSSVFKVPPPPPVLQPEELEFSTSLWNKCIRESRRALYTPFVVCLTSGNLTANGFRDYISQNFHFLTESVRALKMLEAYSVADDDKTKLVELRRSVLNELKADEERDPEIVTKKRKIVKEYPPNPATKKYTDFLLTTASGEIDGVKDVVDKSKFIQYTLGVLVARLRLFAFIFEEIKSLYSDNQFKNEIDKSLTSFEASAGNTEALLDKLSTGLTKDEHDMIEKLYHQAIKLQIEFLSAHPQEEQETVVPLCKMLKPTEHRLLLGAGFDLTCTDVGLSAILAAAMAEKNEWQKEWDAIRKSEDKYVELINDWLLTSEKVEGYHSDNLSKALEAVLSFEEKALDDMIGLGLLKGIKEADIQNAGTGLILQDGCGRFLRKIVQNENLDVDVHVFSCFFCEDLIKSAFSSEGLLDLNVNLHANKLSYDGERISTGETVTVIKSGREKFTEFDALDMKAFEDEKQQLSLYIGSSVGDLLCLLRADIGIVIGSCPILRKVGRHLGVSFVPLFEGVVRKQKEVAEGTDPEWDALPPGTLYIVGCWAEIQAFILGFSS